MGGFQVVDDDVKRTRFDLHATQTSQQAVPVRGRIKTNAKRWSADAYYITILCIVLLWFVASYTSVILQLLPFFGHNREAQSTKPLSSARIFTDV